MRIFNVCPVARPKRESKPKSSAFFASILLFMVSNMPFTMCISVLHIYNRFVFRHIYFCNIISYDIKVVEKFSSCIRFMTGFEWVFQNCSDFQTRRIVWKTWFKIFILYKNLEKTKFTYMFNTSTFRGEIVVKGLVILIAFFLLFTCASLLIPSTMFPGSFFLRLIGESTSEYTTFLSAVFNGTFYGVILWLVFVYISKRIE